MGRYLTAASANPITSLTNTLGNVSANVKDATTVSSLATTFSDNTRWGSKYPSDLSPFFRNTGTEQNITTGHKGVIQDELSGYTYVQSRLYRTTDGSYPVGGAVYDANLNVVYNWSTYAPPYSGTLFCIRLHNSNLYFFSGTSASGIQILKIALPSGTQTTFSYTGISANWTVADSNAVFNWPVNNKFWMFVSTYYNAPYVSLYLTFDLTTETFAQFGTTFTGSSGSYIYGTYTMHVKADGSAVSIPVYNSTTSTRGVFSSTSSASTFTTSNASGHWLYTAGSSTWQVSTVRNASSGGYFVAVTTDAVIDSYNYKSDSTTDSSNYRNVISHLQGGDTAVQQTTFISLTLGIPGTSYYFVSVPQPLVSTTTRNQLLLNLYSTLGGTGRYQVSRSGTTLVIGTKINSAYVSSGTYFAASKLPESINIRLVYTNASSASVAYLSSIYAYENGILNQYDFTVNNTNQNNLASYTDDPFATSFVTSSGKVFSLANYNNSNDINQQQIITSAIPSYTPTKTTNYTVTVIGGGGGSYNGSTTVNGTSSSFSSLLAAANGSSRSGNNPGAYVITSGSAVSTGGAGYGTDKWGQGEDVSYSSSPGGGSGYIATSTLTLTSGTSYLYRAGLAPSYGRQGAILIQEVT
jgi:hypothetical protein